ncbi:beta-ketoacyl-ACP synthase III [Flammeovirga kamogawensis]|uniref:Beta-ketoacyl-[acyl-carrier-protein] synthase III n=1 Tax=Flammeovirga kamogawensis TaxID=373891 RepID=A0ABX8GY70_9BACT|nr:beta-ketoacyl-ACP synthase III [Flammeovirga kamogawensis]MBB6458945.1 3-oxoacyl-[acyl-carrier-protein] synthase-3 [Flammeovirga kamogawensis]QWG08520.1 ketoacyl-ACP synthase III [Flammeovirga kamogawensis]TRX66813.1 ketoacyl-ACP synthase III [Flammeovirga kamogawensis]
MSPLYAAITAVAGWVPEDKLTNHDLEKLVETSDEWITSRTGIKERRILKGENLGTSTLAINAVSALLKKKNIDGSEVDLVICATSTPDMGFISTANIVCEAIHSNAMSFDISAACSGFIYGLEMASNFIKSGNYKKIVVVGADKMSSVMDYSDRNTCILFGDGAGAVLIEPSEEYGLIDSVMHSDGSGKDLLHVKRGSAYPISLEQLAEKEHYFYQDGKSVFKHAVTNMASAAESIMKRNELSSDDIAYLIPHQANLRIIDATAKRMGVSKDRVCINIEKYGNTTGATIPLCLWDFEKQFKKGDNLVFAAFGGGFTWGSIYLKWAYDTE